MLTVYKVVTMDSTDGRSVVGADYFLSEDDAYAFYNRDARFNDKPETIKIWEQGEYSPENVLRQRALAKLSSEERKVLGL